MVNPFPFYHERLPTYQEVHDACYERDSIHISDMFENIEKGIHEMWFSKCREHNIFQLWNKEYIETLASEIKKLIGEDLAVEVAAGDGMLSHWLREHGINIIASDNMSWHEKGERHDRDQPVKTQSEVEKLDGVAAVKKYKPRLVIASWVEYTSTLDIEILEQSPEFFIIIGEGRGGCTGSEELWERFGELEYRLDWFKDLDGYNICRTDSAIPGFKMQRHSTTSLFTRLSSRGNVVEEA